MELGAGARRGLRLITSKIQKDEFSRTLMNEAGEPVGRIVMRLDYTETFDDGVDENGAPSYVHEPLTRQNEVYVVRIEVRENAEAPLKVQSEVTYTGAAMDEIVELFGRMQIKDRK